MSALRRRRARGDRGAVSTELVLITPIVISLLLFVALAGRFAVARNDVVGASRDAARAASVERSAAAASAAARGAAEDSLLLSGLPCLEVTTSVDTSAFQPGGEVVVEVACRVRIRDLALLAIPGERVITATSIEPIDVFRGLG